jgi:uncharacterized iron-regulated membrane protein
VMRAHGDLEECMRRTLLAPFGAILLVGLAVVSAAAAETTPTTSTTAAALPAVCQPDQTTAVTPTTASATTATATTATTTTATSADGEDLAVDDSDNHGHEVRACVDALHDLGEHGLGQIVSALAREEGRHEKSEAGATSTPTATTAAVTLTPQTTTTVRTQPSEDGKAEHHGHSEGHKQGD